MRNVLREINFDDYPCCTTDDGESSFLEVLYGLESILLHMLQRHTCVFFTMLELKIPSGNHLDEYFLITKFIESLERCFRGYKSELCQSALKIDPPSASNIDPPQAVFF